MTLTPSEGYVLSRIDGATSISEIIAISPLGEETLRCVYALVAARVVRAFFQDVDANVPTHSERARGTPAARPPKREDP